LERWREVFRESSGRRRPRFLIYGQVRVRLRKMRIPRTDNKRVDLRDAAYRLKEKAQEALQRAKDSKPDPVTQEETRKLYKDTRAFKAGGVYTKLGWRSEPDYDSWPSIMSFCNEVCEAFPK